MSLPLSFPLYPTIPQERGFHSILTGLQGLWNSNHRRWGFLFTFMEKTLILRPKSSLFGFDILKIWENYLFLKSVLQVYCFSIKSCLKWQKWILCLSLCSYGNNSIVQPYPQPYESLRLHEEKDKCKTEIFLRILPQLHSHLTAMHVCIFSMALICKYCFYSFLWNVLLFNIGDVILSFMLLMSF